MALTDNQREILVGEAKSWIRTPYRGGACLKRLGVDCGQFIYGVYRNCNLLPAIDMPAYYDLHPGVHSAKSILEELVVPYFREIPEQEVKPGDCVIFKTQMRYAARTQGYAHAAIVIDWPNYILHADTRYGVHGDHGSKNPFFRNVPKRFGTLKDEFCGDKSKGTQ